MTGFKYDESNFFYKKNSDTTMVTYVKRLNGEFEPFVFLTNNLFLHTTFNNSNKSITAGYG
jgi:hypothetical protein